MPRPKRTKIASTAPIAPLHKTSTVLLQPWGHLQRETEPGNSSDSTSHGSKSRLARPGARAVRDETEKQPMQPMMSGALGTRDSLHTRRRGVEPKVNSIAYRKDRIQPNGDLQNLSNGVSRKRRSTANVDKIRSTPEQDESIGEEAIVDIVSVSPGAGPSEATAMPHAQLSDEGDLHGSAIRGRKTPTIDSSVLAIANFKRRPRQPSILRMVQESAKRAHRASLSATEKLSDDLASPEPDDEATPFRVQTEDRRMLGRHDATSPQQWQETSSSRKRKFIEDDEETLQIMRSSPPVSPGVDLYGVSPLPEDIVASTFPDLPELDHTEEAQDHDEALPQLNPRQEQEEPYSETMAPPRSCSSPSLPGQPLYFRSEPRRGRNGNARRAQSPASRREGRQRKAKGRKSDLENATDDGLSSSSEDNDEQALAQNGQSATGKRKKDASLALTTAYLQSLLPQRRRQPRQDQGDAFDIPNSSDREEIVVNSDDDELLHSAPRRRKQRNVATKKTKATPLRQVKPTRKSKPTPASAKTPGHPKTYTTRRSPSDKENHALYDSDGDADEAHRAGNRDGNAGSLTLEEDSTLVEASAELRRAADKFKEVDAWEMEFESISIQHGRSSSPAWR